MNLTTIQRVKDLHGGFKSTDTTRDGLIEAIVSAVSGALEGWLDRSLEKKSRTEYHNVSEGQRIFSLIGYPLKTIDSLRYDWERLFAAGDEIDADDYTFDPDDPERGFLYVDRHGMSAGFRLLKVVYTGGMAKSPDRLEGTLGGAGAFIVGEKLTGSTSKAEGTMISVVGSALTMDVTRGIFVVGENLTGATSLVIRALSTITESPLVMAFPEVAQAADLQAVYELQKRQHLGAISVSIAGTSATSEGELNLLKLVKAQLQRYRREGAE